MALDDGSELRRLLFKYYPRLLERGHANAFTALGIDAAFDLENEEVQQVLEQLALRVKGISDTTRQKLQEMVGQAAEEGWGPDEFARRLDESGLFSGDRAEMLAVTETAHAYSAGSILAYRQSGVVDRKQWLVTTDACDICAPLADLIVPLDDEFAPGIAQPGAHPRCRCAVAPILSDA